MESTHSTTENQQNQHEPAYLAGVEDVDHFEAGMAMARVRSAIRGVIEAEAHEREEQERTTAKKKIFLEIYGKTMGTITVACEKADIERTTYYLWKRTDPQFASAVKRIEEQRLDMTEDRLFKLIQGDDGPSVRYFLDRKHPDYKPVSKTELVTGDKTFEDLLYEQAEKKKALAEGIKKPDHGTTE